MDVQAAVQAAIAAGIAPADAAKVARLKPSESYSDQSAVASDYEVRWFPAGHLAGVDEPWGWVIWGGAGWYIRRLDAGEVPDNVRAAFRDLVRASPHR
jgi:hypothetical protein